MIKVAVRAAVQCQLYWIWFTFPRRKRWRNIWIKFSRKVKVHVYEFWEYGQSENDGVDNWFNLLTLLFSYLFTLSPIPLYYLLASFPLLKQFAPVVPLIYFVEMTQIHGHIWITNENPQKLWGNWAIRIENLTYRNVPTHCFWLLALRNTWSLDYCLVGKFSTGQHHHRLVFVVVVHYKNEAERKRRTNGNIWSQLGGSTTRLFWVTSIRSLYSEDKEEEWIFLSDLYILSLHPIPFLLLAIQENESRLSSQIQVDKKKWVVI